MNLVFKALHAIFATAFVVFFAIFLVLGFIIAIPTYWFIDGFNAGMEAMRKSTVRRQSPWYR